MMYTILPYTSNNPTREDVEQFGALYRQLYDEHLPQTKLLTAGIRVTLKRGGYLWVARQDETIVSTGMLIPIFKPLLSKSFGLVEDLVTDKRHRGKIYDHQSLAELIMQEIIRRATSLNLKYLQLTNPLCNKRSGKLFRRIGFTAVGTGEGILYRRYLGGVDELLS